MPTSKNAQLLDDESAPAHTCVIYDPKTGSVAHVHEFYGKGFKADECERHALETLDSLGHTKTAGLKVLHPTELKYEPDTMLRIDTKSLKIVAKKRPVVRRKTTK